MFCKTLSCEILLSKEVVVITVSWEQAEGYRSLQFSSVILNNMTRSWLASFYFSSSSLPLDIDHYLGDLDAWHFHLLCFFTYIAAPENKLISSWKSLCFGPLTAPVCICSNARTDKPLKSWCTCQPVLHIWILSGKSCPLHEGPCTNKLLVFNGIAHCTLRIYFIETC